MLYINPTQIIKRGTAIKPFLSVKNIFSEYWKSYLETHNVREIEKAEVEKMLSCKGKNRGCFVYYCENCKKYVTVPFGCNSRLCSCCGKRHTDRWAEKLSKKILKGISHKHLTFSMPKILWRYIKENRSLQKEVMDASYKATKEMFSLTSK